MSRHTSTGLATLVAATTALSCSDSTSGSTEDRWFEDATAESGIDFVYASGASESYRFPEIMGGGAALFDYDGDGDLDLYLVQSGSLTEPAGRPRNRLMRNEGPGTFVDVTEEAGVGHTGYGMGACVGDYDGDGDIDLYVTNLGPNVLYRNLGDGTFEDVSDASGTAETSWSTSCAFVDLNDDDRLDLFVANNIGWTEEVELYCANYYHEADYCNPNNYNSPVPDTLFKNTGDGRFEDVTRESGIVGAYGNGLGVTCGDFDLDGAIDLYVANDARANQLWRNTGDMKFEEVALISGCAVNGDGRPEAGMGVQFVDVEDDGDLDLFLTHLRDESNTFYRNNSGVFGDATNATGMLGPSIRFTGFGMGFADFDQDGVLDLFVANGAVQGWKTPMDTSERADRYAEPNLLFRGLGDGRFEEIPDCGLGETLFGTSRAAAFGDLDGDGDVDVVVVERDAQTRVLRNVKGDRNRSVSLRVLRGGKDAVGALLSIETSEGTQVRNVGPAYSYLASNDPRVHVGLGGASEVRRVVVTWPGGDRESFGPLAAGKQHLLRAGEGSPTSGDGSDQ